MVLLLKTNNVYVTGTTNKAVYADSIVLNDAALVDKNTDLDPVAANHSYKSLASDTNGNYIVKVVNGSVDLKPRELTVDKINGTVVYGDQKGTGIETGTPGFTPEGNRVITGDIVNIIKGETTPDSSVYDKSSGTPHTDNVGTHADPNGCLVRFLRYTSN